MKIFHRTLIILAAALLFASTTVFAAIQEQVMDDADLTTVKRLAVAYPNHYKAETISDEPNIDALIEMLDTSSKATQFYVIPYTDIVESIKKDKGIDITTLEFREAKKTFEDNIANYADAYLTLTTANNDDPTTFIFKVQDAQTGKLMYLLNANSRSFGKNAKGYTGACELFYKTFDAAIQKAAKGKK